MVGVLVYQPVQSVGINRSISIHGSAHIKDYTYCLREKFSCTMAVGRLNIFGVVMFRLCVVVLDKDAIIAFALLELLLVQELLLQGARESKVFVYACGFIKFSRSFAANFAFICCLHNTCINYTSSKRFYW